MSGAGLADAMHGRVDTCSVVSGENRIAAARAALYLDEIATKFDG